MSTIEDGAQNQAAQFDGLMKRLRSAAMRDINLGTIGRAADVLESQSAELTRLRERNAELESQLERLGSELDVANKQIAETGRAWSADRTRLEVTVLGMREALAQFMIKHSFPTGHGDTHADLLAELDAAIQRSGDAQWNAAIIKAAEAVTQFGVRHYTAEEVAARILSLRRLK